ncbi:MAG: hypothetical protein QXG65_04775 [Thermoplasmata archaeon]
MGGVQIYVTRPPRPLGVTIIALLVMLGALLAVAVGVLTLMGSSLYGITDQFDFFSNPLAASATLIALGAVSFVVAFGLFGQRIWAWAVVIVLELISLIGSLYTFFAVGSPNWGSLVSVPIPAVIVAYLLLVRSYFL